MKHTQINTIYNEDCLDTMGHMPDGFIDLSITSPPYNIDKKYSGYDDNKEDYLAWLSIRLRELARVSKSMWVNLGYRKLSTGNIPIAFQVYDHITGCGHFMLQHLVWEYGAGLTYKTRFNHRKEDWLWFVADKKNYTFNPDDVRDPSLTKYKKDKRNNPNGKLPGDVWYFPHVAGTFKKRKDHPAMFPEKMIERIIKACSNQGDIVYDPFAGTGTTLHVARELNRNYIGSEISEKYCGIMKTERLLG
jgi:adenine-specific DNA-methyltransferase